MEAQGSAGATFQIAGSFISFPPFQRPGDPERDVLTRLPTMTNQDDLGPLLPRNWTPTPTPAPEATTTATATAAPNIVTAS